MNSVGGLLIWLERVIILTASRLVPRPCRSDWLAEWTAELWHVRSLRYPGWKSVRFCLGTFRDAVWCLRNMPDTREETRTLLDSPLHCLATLAALATASVLLAFTLSSAREWLLPSPYPAAVSLVKMASRASADVGSRTVSFSSYQELTRHRTDLFHQVAYYQPISAWAQFGDKKPASLTIGVTSREFFEVLGWADMPARVTSGGDPDAPQIFLTPSAHDRYVPNDGGLRAARVNILGRFVQINRVFPYDCSALPGAIDGWLVVDSASLRAFAANGSGFVLAQERVATMASVTGPERRIAIHTQSGGISRFDCRSLAWRTPLAAHLLLLLVALLILPATTTLEFGSLSGGSRHEDSKFRMRRWLFFTVKVTLVLVIVFFGALNLSAISHASLQAHGLQFGYVLGLRWALNDQRRRCPVCLARLGHPARIGRSSQTFLDWYGTEVMCPRGHGLMHIPELQGGSCSARRWMNLDPSWSGLFHAPARRLLDNKLD